MQNENILTVRGRPMTYPTSVRLEIPTYQRLVNLAHKQKRNLSDVLMDFIRAGLNEAEGNGNGPR